MATDVVLAQLTINDAATMTPKQAVRVSAWLRKQADAFEDQRKNYASRLVARLLEPPPKVKA